MTPMEQDFVEVLVLAHRYLYYVEAESILTDTQYDTLESNARLILPRHSAVFRPGSSNHDDYDWRVLKMVEVVKKYPPHPDIAKLYEQPLEVVHIEYSP